MSSSYALNERDLSHNTFGDEVIVIHLPSGVYFSLHTAAAVIWQQLQAGPTTAEALAGLFQDPPPDVVAHVQSFLEQLQAQSLVVPAQAAAAPAIIAKTPFTPPTLEPFDDLAPLLLADIIHDTEEQGWPHLSDAGTPLLRAA